MLSWKKHAILVPPTPEEIAQMEPEKLIQLHTLYHKAIHDAESDPYRYGLRLSSWHRADKYISQRNETVILGGNRSSKTTYAGSVIVKAAMENANATIWCFAQTNEVSISVQQAAIYAALPAEMRGSENVTGYTKKNGFPRNSAGKCSVHFPNGSEVTFKAYSQFLNNDTILEGAELGCREPNWVNIGAWCDEYLVGPELLETLRFRTLDRAAKILVTFTPIDGYTEVVRDYLHNARTVEWGVAELLNDEKVPLVQESKNRNATIIYFHTKENPYAGYKQMVETLAGRPKEEVLTRAYGVATKSVVGKFPMFSREVNVIKDELLPDLKTCTLYMVLDPAGSKNWFMCWIAVDPTETYYVYREWPDQNDGDWAVWHGGQWTPGPGSKGLGYGIRDYVDLIKRYEGKEEIFERLIDPRLGAAKYQTQTGASSMIEELADAGMVFVPAPGLEIEDGIQALQSKMAYDKTKPMDSLNRPHFYVSERCENIIKALQEYTGEEGSTEAWKDPIDVIRYAAIDGIRYLDLKNMKPVKPRKGY